MSFTRSTPSSGGWAAARSLPARRASSPSARRTTRPWTTSGTPVPTPSGYPAGSFRSRASYGRAVGAGGARGGRGVGRLGGGPGVRDAEQRAMVRREHRGRYRRGRRVGRGATDHGLLHGNPRAAEPAVAGGDR